MLSSRQSAVADALAQRQTKKYPLARWYLGAVRALGDDLNPDSAAQAAHSLRELIEKLPLVLQGESIFAPTDYKKLRAEIRDRLRQEDPDYPECTWEGKLIGPNLASALKSVITYLEKNEKPDRVEHVISSIASLDPMFASLSPEISRRKSDIYQSVWLGLQETAHHGLAQSDVRTCIERIEDFILEVVAPVAESDRQEILKMLAAGPQQPGAAKQMRSLVVKRGANFVLFFQKINDPGWLVHIEAEGFFANPPSADHTNWGAVRRGVCDFLEAAIGTKHSISKSYHAAVWRLVEALVTTSDPDLEKAYEADSGFGGPLSVAINRTRSRALEVAISTAAWSDDVETLRRLLSARLDGRPALSLPERALLVVNFPRLMALDESWASAHVVAIFPRKPVDEWLALMSEFLVYTRAYTNLWPVIKGELDHALKNLSALAKQGPGPRRDQASALGQHLFFYYLFGLTPLDGPDSLLLRYLSK